MPLRSNYKVYRIWHDNSVITFTSRLKTKMHSYRILQVLYLIFTFYIYLIVKSFLSAKEYFGTVAYSKHFKVFIKGKKCFADLFTCLSQK